MFTARFIQTIQTKQITAYKVAKETGISQGLMSEYKNGVKLPTVQNLVKIADYLGCSVDYLLGRTDNPPAAGTKEKPKYQADTWVFLRLRPIFLFYICVIGFMFASTETKLQTKMLMDFANEIGSIQHPRTVKIHQHTRHVLA